MPAFLSTPDWALAPLTGDPSAVAVAFHLPSRQFCWISEAGRTAWEAASTVGGVPADWPRNMGHGGELRHELNRILQTPFDPSSPKDWREPSDGPAVLMAPEQTGVTLERVTNRRGRSAWQVTVHTVPGRLRLLVPDRQPELALSLAESLPAHFDYRPAATATAAQDLAAPAKLRFARTVEVAPEPIMPDAAWQSVAGRQEALAGLAAAGNRFGLAYQYAQETVGGLANFDTTNALTQAGSFFSLTDHAEQTDPATRQFTAVVQRRDLAHSGIALREAVSALIARLWRANGWFVLHCAAVIAPNGEGWVFPASSGHGKTALLLTLARRGFKLIGDDKLLLRREPVGAGCSTGPAKFVIRGYPMQRYVNLCQDVGDRFADLAFIKTLRQSPTWPKVRIDMAQVGLGSEPATVMTPARLGFPHIVTAAAATLRTPISRREAVERLLQQSVVAVEPRLAEAHLRLLCDLAHQCVAEDLALGADIYAAPDQFCRVLGVDGESAGARETRATPATPVDR